MIRYIREEDRYEIWQALSNGVEKISWDLETVLSNPGRFLFPKDFKDTGIISAMTSLDYADLPWLLGRPMDSRNGSPSSRSGQAVKSASAAAGKPYPLPY